MACSNCHNIFLPVSPGKPFKKKMGWTCFETEKGLQFTIYIIFWWGKALFNTLKRLIIKPTSILVKFLLQTVPQVLACSNSKRPENAVPPAKRTLLQNMPPHNKKTKTWKTCMLKQKKHKHVMKMMQKVCCFQANSSCCLVDSNIHRIWSSVLVPWKNATDVTDRDCKRLREFSSQLFTPFYVLPTIIDKESFIFGENIGNCIMLHGSCNVNRHSSNSFFRQLDCSLTVPKINCQSSFSKMLLQPEFAVVVHQQHQPHRPASLSLLHQDRDPPEQPKMVMRQESKRQVEKGLNRVKITRTLWSRSKKKNRGKM